MCPAKRLRRDITAGAANDSPSVVDLSSVSADLSAMLRICTRTAMQRCNPSARIILSLIQPSTWESVHRERANFTELVVNCIDADFFIQIYVGNLSPRSTQWTLFYRSHNSIFVKSRGLFANFTLQFTSRNVTRCFAEILLIR